MKGKREQKSNKPWLFLAIGVVILLFAAYLILFVLPDKDTPPPSETQTPPPSAAPSAEIDEAPWLIGGENEADPLVRPHQVLDLEIPDTQLVLESVGQYTGPNIEDGQDTPSGNAASVVVRNDSDQTLQYASLTLAVNGQNVTFKLTTLPPGARMQAIALDGQAYQSDATYTYVSCETAYQPTLSKQEDRFTVTGEAGSLTLTNLTDETCETVWVYYKYKQGSLYLGGITYRCTFQNVGPGESVTQPAGHYDPASSEIMMVDTN